MKFLLEAVSMEQQIIDALEDHFMDYYGNAGYILPDGVLIGTWTDDENEFEFSNHGNVEDYLKTINLSNKKGDFADGSPTMKEIGAIRINNEELENNYIELPLIRPTNKALDTLRDWLDKNQRQYPYIIITTANFNSDAKYSYSEYTSDDIIKRIKRYYASGNLYEQLKEKNN